MASRPRPDSAIVYGRTLQHPDYPGVRFVVPWYPAPGDWKCPAVLVDDDILDSRYVLDAVVAFGRQWRLTAVMRKAHRQWEREVLPRRLRDVGLEIVNEAEELLRG